ncbi:MAG: hypothetical protein IEMM0008_0476 [bacterium]|nr:MAG: hypothetical protein IEMM0008_0476 [bacterium]
MERVLELYIINAFYLVAAILFILGLKGLAHPRKAVKGNMLGSIAVLIAIVTTLIDHNVILKDTWEILVVGFAVGGLIGVILAIKVEMTSMPELVALFNGFGGLASVLVAGGALI